MVIMQVGSLCYYLLHKDEAEVVKISVKLRMENIDKVAKCWNFCMLSITSWCQQCHIARVSWQGIGSTGAACPIQVGQCGESNHSEVKDFKGIFLGFVVCFFPPLFLSQRGWKQLSKKCKNLPTCWKWTQSHRLSQNYVCSVTFPARGSRRVNSNNFIGMTKAQVITGLKEKKNKNPKNFSASSYKWYELFCLPSTEHKIYTQ